MARLPKPCVVCKKLTDGSPRCHAHQRTKSPQQRELERQREQRRTATGRNTGPGRVVRYDSEWRRVSAARRAEQPYCQRCSVDTSLTVDHETLWVLCRSCHGKLEAERRAQKRAS